VHEVPDRRRVPEDEALANAHAILVRAAAWLPTLMIGPPWTGEPDLDVRVRRLSERLAGLCGALAVPFLPVCDSLAGADAWLREAAEGDGIQPAGLCTAGRSRRRLAGMAELGGAARPVAAAMTMPVRHCGCSGPKRTSGPGCLKGGRRPRSLHPTRHFLWTQLGAPSYPSGFCIAQERYRSPQPRAERGPVGQHAAHD
jgi:hypothetical protein